MKKRTRGWKPAKVVLVIYLMTGMLLLTGYPLDSAAAADLTLKISRLEKALDLIDSMGTPDTGQLPTAAVRDMLQGVNWIDDERAIVLSWGASGEHPYAAILVPYQQANPDFEAAYHAISHQDYYILSLPPGEAVTIPESIEKEMVEASRDRTASTVSLTLALRQLISANRQRIDNVLDTVGQMTSQDEKGPLAPAAEDVRQMLVGLVDIAQQIELLSLSLDLNDSQLIMISESVPKKESNLSAFFASGGMTTRLDGYRPEHDITFRARSYDVDAALDMLNIVFGSFYQKTGIDFEGGMALAGHFTGETAGGMTYGKDNRVLVESMAVLKNDVDAETFMDSVYLPWVEAYGRSVTRLMEKEIGRPIDSMVFRMPDSTIGGHRVTGIKMALPASPLSFGDRRQGGEENVMTYVVRTAVKGNLLLMAPDDQRMAEMIRMAGNLIKKTSHGPMITMELDMGKYLSSLARFIPGHGIDQASIPDIGTISFVAAAGIDRIISSIAISTDDIRMMMAYLKRLPPGEGGRSPAAAPTAKTPTAKAPTAKASTAKTPTAKAPTAKTPAAKTPAAKAPTAKASTAKASTAKTPTAKAPAAKTPTAKALTAKASTAKTPTAKAPAAVPQTKKPVKQTVRPMVREAGYWMEQGRLAATYGAYTSAIGYYKKALSMGVEESRVLFNMGIAYGELGDYQRALDHLNQAIQAAPEQGAYHYARARVHLLSGEKEMAMADFEHAAVLGDLDALRYLEAAGQ